MNFERWLESEPRSRLDHLLATDARVLGGCDLGCTSVGVSWWSTGALPLSRWSFLVVPSSLIHYPRCSLTVVHHFGRLPQPWNESRNKRFPLFRVEFPQKPNNFVELLSKQKDEIYSNASGKFVWARPMFCLVVKLNIWNFVRNCWNWFLMSANGDRSWTENATFELRQGEHQHWGSDFIEINFLKFNLNFIYFIYFIEINFFKLNLNFCM